MSSSMAINLNTSFKHSCYKLGIAFIYTLTPLYLWFLLSRCRTLSTTSLCLELASAPASAASMAVLGRQLRSRRTRTLRTVPGQQRITWLLVQGWAGGIYTNTGNLIFMVSHSIIITTL